MTRKAMTPEQRGLTQGVCLAAALMVTGWGEDGLAELILWETNIDRAEALRAGVDDIDLEPLTPVFKANAEKEKRLTRLRKKRQG